MGNWYASREQIKRAAVIEGTEHHVTIDRLIEAVSRDLDGSCRTRFIPTLDTRYLPYTSKYVRGGRLYFDADLWSLTTLKDQGTTLRALTSGTHFILQPENDGPPYHWAEILTSQSLNFESGATTPQRSFEIVGMWSRHSATQTASQLDGAITTTTATTLSVDNGSLIDVGNTLLIGTEALFVTERDETDLGVNSTVALAADDTVQTLTLADPAIDLSAGEIIRIGVERMRVTAVSSATSVTVERAWDGTTLATHATDQDIHVFRRFTVERAANGTTATTHLDNAAVSKYVVPKNIEELCIAEVIAALQQERAGWGRAVGTGERQVELSGRALSDLRKRTIGQYRRNLMGSF